MTQKQMTEKEELKAARLARTEADSAEEKKLNEGKTGKGLRKSIAYTRGRSTQRVVYDSFDTDQPDTLPKDMTEFQTFTEISDEPLLVSFLIDGFNAWQFANASDPITEHLNPAWSNETKTKFKNAVKGMVQGADVTIDFAVEAIKPAFDANFAKAQAALTVANGK